MTLKEYMDTLPGQKKVVRFAQSVGVTGTTVWRWLNRTRNPSRDSVKKIVAATGGSVTYDDLYRETAR